MYLLEIDLRMGDSGICDGDYAPDLCVYMVEWWQTRHGSYWPGDDIWKHTSGSTLAPVMACCRCRTKPLPGPVDWSVRFCGIRVSAISQRVLMLLFCIMRLKIMLWKLLPHPPRVNELVSGLDRNKIWKTKYIDLLSNGLSVAYTRWSLCGHSFHQVCAE